MSKVISATKSLPLCLSLGVSTVLQEDRMLEDDLLDQFSLTDKTVFLSDTDNFILVCGNKQKPRVTQPNHSLVSLAVRRALALKNHTRLPVIITVNNRYEGAIVVELFNKLMPCFNLYNTINSQNDKINEEINADFLNEADFLLTTYSSLWKKVSSEEKPSCEYVVFINPLTRKSILNDVAKLDIIISCFHTHKSRKPNFSYILDEAQFPVLTKKEYTYLLNSKSNLFFRCEEGVRTKYDNPFRGAIPKLKEEQFQLFILKELFRGRKTLKELLKRFKMTITYKLHLFSNGIFSVKEEEYSKKIAERKKKLDNLVYVGLIKQLNLFTKGNSKTIYGTISSNDFAITSEQNSVQTFSWEEQIETPGFLPLVTKKPVDSKYYLSAIGKALFAASTNFGGVAVNFSAILDHFSKMLYKDGTTKRFSLKQIIYFYLKLIGIEEVANNFVEKIPEEINAKHYESLIKQLEEGFSNKRNSFPRHCAKSILEAFEKLMEIETYLFFQQFKNYQKEEKRSWKERRREAILRRANYQPLTVKYTGDKYHMLWQEAKKELEDMVKEELLVKINTYNSYGQLKLKYLTQELLDANPHLQKNCGNCQWYKKRFKTCTYLRLLQANDPSKVHSDQREHANGTIEEEATSCFDFEDKAKYETIEDGVRFTLTFDELNKRMKQVPTSYILQGKADISYRCLSCQEPIEEFGSEDKLFFPRKKIVCPNCSTIYLQKKKGKVTVRTQHRHLLRSLYYKATASVPQVLKENDPSYVFVINDTENISLEINEANDDSTFNLVISKHKVPLEKVQYLFFSGQRYQDLEETLRNLANLEPERYIYKIKRAEQNAKKKAAENSESNRLQPFSSEENYLVKQIIKIISNKEMFNQKFLRGRHLSNISGMLSVKKERELESMSDWPYNHQLLAMIDLLIRVEGGVKSRYYGSLLEGQSNIYFFELLKTEAERVDLWTKGRVNSRLVKDMLLSFSKNVSSAFSPCDAILNQLLRVFRSVIDEVFLIVGLEPALLGPGLFHRRKTKSDIDNFGFYFDLIEAVRVLVLVTMSKAIKNGTLDFNDCSYVLGEDGQEIYRVKGSSLEKVKELVLDALDKPVFYQGETIPFLEAFESNLIKLRAALENCFAEIRKNKKMSAKKIKQCFEEAEFAPFVFCPAGIEKALIKISHFAHKEGVLFRGREEEVLSLKIARESFRREAMKKWLVKDLIFGVKEFRITKHQQKEQDRSLLVLMLMFYLTYERNFSVEKYSTSHLRELLGLTQNQVQRILNRMVTHEFLILEKIIGKNYYKLNLENQSIKELRFALGVTLSSDEVWQRELITNIPYHLERASKVITTIKDFSGNQRKTNFLWSNWEPTTILSGLLIWVENQISESSEYFKILGEINDNKRKG
ncbi:MAG: hypothetical protein HZR80_03695 [Candidatus Heimdallarchaeota archaeon]